jgi:hypothetical protein
MIKINVPVEKLLREYFAAGAAATSATGQTLQTT